jgi:tetratricopeptide (TPR) repeat protein
VVDCPQVTGPHRGKRRSHASALLRQGSRNAACSAQVAIRLRHDGWPPDDTPTAPSIFVGQHDSDHAHGDDRVGRIGGQVFQVSVKIIDLEKDRVAFGFERQTTSSSSTVTAVTELIPFFSRPAAGLPCSARHLLEQAVDRETAAVAEHQTKVAELVAARGDNAATQLHYTDAARYYNAAAAQLPPSATEKKLLYLLQAGDMWRTAGNLAAALTSYQTSRSIAERLDPGNAGWQRDLSVSQERIGNVQQAQGDLAAALATRKRVGRAGERGSLRPQSSYPDRLGREGRAQGRPCPSLAEKTGRLATIHGYPTHKFR